MSSTIWTADALRSEARPWSGRAWRLVEAQHVITTSQLVDSDEDQAVLEDLLDDSKPPAPRDCSHLHYLLFTPFRYAPYPFGSRFRRAGRTPGVFYASEDVEAAVAEMAHYRMQFYRESPGVEPPYNAATYTGIQVAVKVPAMIDLTEPPFAAHEPVWIHPTEYGPCQAFAEVAREAGVEVILSKSTRDPDGRKNVNILTCGAFEKPKPVGQDTWQIKASANEAIAIRDFPRSVLRFAA